MDFSNNEFAWPRRGLLTALTGVGAGSVALSGPSAGSAPVASGDLLDVRQFGARCDGRTDDTAAVQAAIAAASGGTLSAPIVIPGPCRLNEPVRIRRPVDTSLSTLRIVGMGPGAGFTSVRAQPMFVGEAAKDDSPGTEFIRFENIRFEGRPGTGPVMSGDFLRIVFVACEFIAVACLLSDRYAQEWRFLNCLARGWEGPFFKAAGGYGVTSSSSKYQFGGAVFHLADPTLRKNGCVGCSFVQDIYEGSTGPFLAFELGRGVSVQGLYAEANAQPTVVVGARALSTGVSVSGCFLGTRKDNVAAPDFAEIVWNSVDGAVSIGNTALGRLHRRDARAMNFTSLGDYSGVDASR